MSTTTAPPFIGLDDLDNAVGVSLTPLPQAQHQAVKQGLGVLLAVPTRGYVWHETAKALEPYNPQYIKEKLSVASGRNRIVRDFLKTKADALVMVDDDVIPPPGFLEDMALTPYDVVAAPVPIAKLPAHVVFTNVFTVEDDGRIMTFPGPDHGHAQVDAVGSGCILIHRRVLEHETLEKPFDQIIDPDGVILVGQDLNFCRRVREAGFSIGANFDMICDHFIPVHANAVALAYQNHQAELDRGEV